MTILLMKEVPARVCWKSSLTGDTGDPVEPYNGFWIPP
jgi:hypothetical protein